MDCPYALMYNGGNIVNRMWREEEQQTYPSPVISQWSSSLFGSASLLAGAMTRDSCAAVAECGATTV